MGHQLPVSLTHTSIQCSPQCEYVGSYLNGASPIKRKGFRTEKNDSIDTFTVYFQVLSWFPQFCCIFKCA